MERMPFAWCGLSSMEIVDRSSGTCAGRDCWPGRRSDAAFRLAARDSSDPKPVECLRLLLFCSWIVIPAVADKRVGVKTSVDELHPLGMLCLVLDYSVAWSHLEAIGGVGGLARSLPRGVIITVAGSGAISLVVKETGFELWLTAHLKRSTAGLLVKQSILAVSASIITELVSNSSALSLLLPVAVDVVSIWHTLYSKEYTLALLL
ncbi:uncharacterized protein LOC144107832 [Amblyomma americanum]